MKKRNCRKTEEEKAVHDRAVSIRKMTDAQICEFIDHTYQRGVAEGAELAASSSTQAAADGGASARKFITFLEGRVGSGNRIDKGTILYLSRELEAAQAAGLFSGAAQ